MNAPLPTHVLGHRIRTTNAAEATDQAQIPGLWQRATSDEALLSLPARADECLYAVLFDYESDADATAHRGTTR